MLNYQRVTKKGFQYIQYVGIYHIISYNISNMFHPFSSNICSKGIKSATPSVCPRLDIHIRAYLHRYGNTQLFRRVALNIFQAIDEIVVSCRHSPPYDNNAKWWNCMKLLVKWKTNCHELSESWWPGGSNYRYIHTHKYILIIWNHSESKKTSIGYNHPK